MRRFLALLLFLFAPFVVMGQDYVQNYSFVNPGTSTSSQSFANSGVTSFFMSWTPQVTLASCAVQVDSSSDGITWGSGDLIASQNCATAGSSGTPQSLAAGKNFLRVHVTALVGNGGLNVTIKGWGGGGGGGGLTSVSSLPATCTPGITANVVLNTGGFNVLQEYQCGPQVNTWFPFNPTLAVSPFSFGAKWDVKAVTDAVFTLNSNTVTCPNAECGFSNSDLGKIVFATTYPAQSTTGCNGSGCGTYLLTTSQGFICTVNSATSINIGTTFPACAADNANGNCTGGGGTICALVWGTQDDSTAINNAATAAWTGTGATTCQALEFPSGMAFFQPPLLSVTIPAGGACGSNILDTTQTGPVVFGQGMGNTVLVPLPSSNFANCTLGVSGTGCISGPPNWIAHDWGINGFGQSGNGTTHANNLIEFNGQQPSCTAEAAWNMGFSNWQAASTSAKGFVFNSGCGTIYASNIVSEAFAPTNCVFNATSNTVTVNALDCFGSGGTGTGATGSLLVIMAGTGLFSSTGSTYWGVNTGAANGPAGVRIQSTGAGNVFNSFSDTILGPSNGNNDYGMSILTDASGVTVNLSGSRVAQTNSTGAGNTPLFFCDASSTCNISAYGATLTASGTKEFMFRNFGTALNFYDACANKFTHGSVANVITNVFGSCSITGTPITAAKLVLSAGWGTTAAWSALSGSTQQVFGTITASGTGQTANPTITYTFPTQFIPNSVPTGCFALQIGGTQAGVAIPFTPSALSATGVTFTYNGTPGAGNTLVVQIQCWNP